MTRLDDLRRTLETHAELAPAGAGLVAAAHVRAAHIRRRRRITAVATAAVVAAVTAVAIPVTWHLRAAPVIPPATHRINPDDRKAGELTISIAPGTGLTVDSMKASGYGQDLTVSQSRNGKIAFQAIVQALDPEAGRPPAQPQAGVTVERVTVQGQPATYFAPVATIGRTFAVHALVWMDPSGLAIRVGQLDLIRADRPLLTKLAEAVRVGAPRPITQSFHLGGLPAGLTVGSVQAGPAWAANSETTLVWPADAFDVPIKVQSLTKLSSTPGGNKGFTATTPIDGRRTWYDSYYKPQDALIVDGGNCWVRFFRSTTVTMPQLRNVAEHTTYGDCKDKSTWTPPVG